MLSVNCFVGLNTFLCQHSQGVYHLSSTDGLTSVKKVYPSKEGLSTKLYSQEVWIIHWHAFVKTAGLAKNHLVTGRLIHLVVVSVQYCNQII